MERTLIHLKISGAVRRALTLHFSTWVRWSLLLLMAHLVWVEVGCKRRPPPLPPPTTAPPVKSDSTTSPDQPTDKVPQLVVRIEPEIIRKGASALLIWEAHNAGTVLVNHNIGVVEAVGKIKFFPKKTTTYRVSASIPGGVLVRTATVVVIDENAGRIESKDLRDRSLRERFEQIVAPVFFSFDSAELSDEAKEILAANGRWFSRPENSELCFVIEGHCDDRGTEEYNLSLGDKRARVVKAYLELLGVPSFRMQTVSLGEEASDASDNTEQAYALKRRAGFVLIEEDADSP